MTWSVVTTKKTSRHWSIIVAYIFTKLSQFLNNQGEYLLQTIGIRPKDHPLIALSEVLRLYR